MKTIKATELKNRLGAALAEAALGPVAIERHGRVVALLVPPPRTATRRSRRQPRAAGWNREVEERVIELCAKGDLRPSRWLRAGDSRTLAGIATMLASHDRFGRSRMLRLAERLNPGITKASEFAAWLAETPVNAARLLPMIDRRMHAPALPAFD